ncbi:MAG: hypothetical protein PHW45_01150 [Candidatus ainarchaeum sp.]|nr:hypothetical protein [Candidatus ainarchaeum sp.]
MNYKFFIVFFVIIFLSANIIAIDCSDFSISGQTDIYVDEDRSFVYDLFIMNSIEEPLSLISITTGPLNDLDLDNINYPFTVPSYSTRSADLFFTSDTVSSDTSSFFDIYLVGKYGDLVCEKEYTVNYHIKNKENKSTANCSDLRFENTDFVMDEDDWKSFDVQLKNISLDYDFKIEEAKIKDTSIYDAQVSYFPRKINLDESKDIKLRVSSKKVDNSKTEKSELYVKGYMVREGREDKRCVLREPIKIKVLDHLENSSQDLDCQGIVIQTSTISQLENSSKDYSSEDGFYVINNSNKKFNINFINISDNSRFVNITKKSLNNSSLLPTFKSFINFTLDTSSVETLEKVIGKISLTGSFENGKTCTYSDISSDFKINILDGKNRCSSIGFESQRVENGENTIVVYNNTSMDFTADGFFVDNRRGVNVNVVDDSKKIKANSSEVITVGVNGTLDGFFNLLLKGKFQDGSFCDYTDTYVGRFFLEKSNIFDPDNENNSCDFILNYPSKLITNDDPKLNFNLNFKNKTNKKGIIRLYSDGLTLNTTSILLTGNDSISRNIITSNFGFSKKIYYAVQLEGCSEEIYFTDLVLSTPDQADEYKINFTSFPSSFLISKNKILTSVSLENENKVGTEFKLVVKGLPNDWNIYNSQSEINIKEKLGNLSYTEDFIIEGKEIKKINYLFSVPDSYLNSETEKTVDFEVVVDNKVISKVSTVIKSVVGNEDISLDVQTSRISSSFPTIGDDNKFASHLIKLKLSNNTDVSKGVNLDLELPLNFTIEGDRNIVVPANSFVDSELRIFSNQDLSSNYLATLKVVDSLTGSLLVSKEITLDSKKNFYITGLFNFNSVGNSIKSIILILLFVLVIFYTGKVIFKNSKKKGKGEDLI